MIRVNMLKPKRHFFGSGVRRSVWLTPSAGWPWVLLHVKGFARVEPEAREALAVVWTSRW